MIVVSAIVGIWWLNRFRSGYPLDIDESRYLAFGAALKDGLASGGPHGLWNAWSAQHDFGPLLPLTSAAVYVVLGESVVNGLASQLIFFAVLVAATYGIGARLTSRSGGALAALVVAATPAVIDFTRSYQFPVTAAAMLAACTYALLASEGLSRRRWAVAWGVLLGLTALSRTMMVAFIPAQLVAAGWLVLRRPGARRPRAVNAGIALACAVAVSAVWFASSAGAVSSYLASFGFGRESTHFGTTHSRLSIGYWTRELVAAVQSDLYLPLAALLAIAFVLALAALAARPRSGLRGRLAAWLTTDAAVVAFVLLAGYIALASTRNEGVGFRVPLVAALVTLAVAAIWVLPWRWARTGLVAALVAVSAFNVLMKADVVSGASKRVVAHVPGFGTTPVVLGEGYIQTYLGSALVASQPSPTQPLPAAQKGWLPAYGHAVEQAGGAQIVALGTSEPLVNANDFSLAARLRLHRDLAIFTPSSSPGAPTLASYRALLLRTPRPGVLITVSRIGLSYVALTGGVPLDQRLLERAALSLGFIRAGTVALPDGRTLDVWR